MIIIRLVFFFSIFLSVLLFSSSAISDVHDPFIVEGKVQSEYPPGKGTGNDWLTLWYVNNGLHGDEGCLFDADKSPVFGCAGRRLSSNVWGGTTQRRDACGGSTDPIGDSWLGCLSYTKSPHFQINSPQDKYWVLHVNNDPAFDQCREGPPSLSETITNYKSAPEKLFNVKSEKVNVNDYFFLRQLGIKINAAKHDFNCAGEFELTIPFISIGSHTGAGNPDFLTTINRSGATNDTLGFSAKIGDYSPFTCTESGCPGSSSVGSHTGFFIVAEWASSANTGDPSIDYPKFVWVDLLQTGGLSSALAPSSTGFWSWPIFDSMFWPGAEIAFMDANTASSCPDLVIHDLTIGAGDVTHYTIGIKDLFLCASDHLNLFQAPMPAGDIKITGVHFFAEAANATSGNIEMLLRNIRVQ